MKTNPKTKLAAAFAAAALSLATSASDGFNLWATGKLEHKINDWSKLALQQELWYDADRLYKENSLLNVSFKLADWISVAPGFRFEAEKKKGDWHQECRPTLDFVFKCSIYGWKLEDRLRFELRDKDDSSRAYMRYRNRIRVSAPWKWTEYKINPFASWEMFVEDKPGVDASDMWNRNRYVAGFSAKFTENFSGALFYMVQSSKSGDEWCPIHCPAIEFKYTF